MKIELWWIGKTNEKYLKNGIEIYSKRLKHYHNFNVTEIRDVKSVKTPSDLKQKEAEAFLRKIDNKDFLVLLDENGETYDSIQFADKIQELLLKSAYKRIIFLIAGAYGASEELKSRANLLLSLSKMTFSHQMIRLIFLEQLYRASTILKNESYHNN